MIAPDVVFVSSVCAVMSESRTAPEIVFSVRSAVFIPLTVTAADVVFAVKLLSFSLSSFGIWTFSLFCGMRCMLLSSLYCIDSVFPFVSLRRFSPLRSSRWAYSVIIISWPSYGSTCTSPAIQSMSMALMSFAGMLYVPAISKGPVSVSQPVPADQLMRQFLSA